MHVLLTACWTGCVSTTRRRPGAIVNTAITSGSVMISGYRSCVSTSSGYSRSCVPWWIRTPSVPGRSSVSVWSAPIRERTPTTTLILTRRIREHLLQPNSIQCFNHCADREPEFQVVLSGIPVHTRYALQNLQLGLD